MDWLINMLGFGTLTPMAAWAISGRPLHGAMAAVLWSFTPLFAALYPLTQLYQLDEDRARGDHTLAVRLGPRNSLTVAVFCAGIGFGMLSMAAWRSGWRGGRSHPVGCAGSGRRRLGRRAAALVRARPNRGPRSNTSAPCITRSAPGH